MQRDVAHDLGIARFDLDGAEPAVMIYVHPHAKELIFQRSCLGYTERLRHAIHEVRLANLPFVSSRPADSWRGIGPIAFRRAGVDPINERAELFVREPLVVQ